MNQCPVCQVGQLREERVETWMQKAGQWVLLRGVPASKCDACGETSFPQHVAERIADIVAPGSTVAPTGSRWSPEYDLEEMDARRDRDVAPKLSARPTG